jgi:hypothetical protein
MLWQTGLSSQVSDLFLMKKMHISEYFFVTSYLIIPVTPNKQKNIYTKNTSKIQRSTEFLITILINASIKSIVSKTIIKFS